MSNHYINPAVLILARLANHTATGGLLEGLNWMDYEPIQNIQEVNLPYMHPFQFSMSEEGFAGAPRHPNGVVNKRADQNLFFWIAANVENGWVGEETTTLTYGVLRWLPLICDAIETDENGNADPLLGGELNQPMQFSVNLTEQTQLSWDILLQIKLYTRHFTLSERSL